MAVVSARGARVTYSRTGTGVPVLLIQGVGTTGDAWRPQVDGLQDRFSLITFDNRGIGASTITDGSVSIEAMADDALAILDAEGVDRCHVVGHAMGGLVAMQLALTSPRRVRSLTLLSTFPIGKIGSRLTWRNIRMVIRTLVGIEPSIIRRQLRAMSRFDPTWRLRCLAATRTLVVTGKQDRIALPEHGRKLASAIPGATYLELENAGHAMAIESAALINRLLAEHMTDVGHLSATRKHG